MNIFQYELSDHADFDAVKELMVELFVRYEDWIMAHDIVTSDEGSYLNLKTWNGREGVWQRMYQGDTLTFFGEATAPIEGFPSDPLITQIATGPQQLMAEAMLGDLMGNMGLPSPTQMMHEMSEGDPEDLVAGMEDTLTEAIATLRKLMEEGPDSE